MDQIVGQTTAIVDRYNGTPASPGALVDLIGAGFAPSSATAESNAETSLNGFRFRIDDSYAAVLAITPITAKVQIPWDLDTSDPTKLHAVQVENGADSGFVTEISLRVRPATPTAVRDSVSVVAHANFDGLVSMTSPALLGESVHAYAIGLGAVDPPIALGAATPADPLSRVVGGISCVASEGFGSNGPTGPDVPVSYAGLAPGLIGYYQIDLQLPTKYRPTVGVYYYMTIDCKVGPSAASLNFSFPFQPN
jgi:uncharacterized protein (TIGR03437 family)